MIVVGIDPGKDGGIAIASTQTIVAYKMPQTERDIFDLLKDEVLPDETPVVFLEKVHSMPGQGVSSSFSFGRGYGFLRGVITALRYPLHEVTPQKWQKALGCLSRGDKNVTKGKAQQLFPQLKITHLTADALLIMEYGRRQMAMSYERLPGAKVKPRQLVGEDL